jgi:hypothetical protein
MLAPPSAAGVREDNVMSSYKNLLLSVLGLAALGFAALAWKQHLELIELRSTALINGQRADWRKRALPAQERSKDSDRQPAGVPRSEPATVSLPATGPAPTGPGGANSRSPVNPVAAGRPRLAGGRYDTFGPCNRGRDECASLGGRPRPGLNEAGYNASAVS